jgi:hypothetical protein
MVEEETKSVKVDLNLTVDSVEDGETKKEREDAYFFQLRNLAM